MRGYPPSTAGLYALPAGLTQFAVATVARPLVVRHGIRAGLAGGLLACTAGLLTLTS